MIVVYMTISCITKTCGDDMLNLGRFYKVLGSLGKSISSAKTSAKYLFWRFVAGICYHIGSFCCLLGFLTIGNWWYRQIMACTWRGQVRKQ